MSANTRQQATCRVFEVEGGWCAAARTRVGICAFLLRMSDADSAESKILSACEGAVLNRRGLGSLVAAVRRYFDGWRTEFADFKLDLSHGTEFQQRVQYKRALEGELSRLIIQMKTVNAAKVSLALPEKSLFIEDEKRPTASVVVDVSGGRRLTEKKRDHHFKPRIRIDIRHVAGGC